MQPTESPPVLAVEMPQVMTTQTQTDASVEHAPVASPPGQKRRWPLVVLASVFLTCGAAFGIFALAPEHLDGLPGRGGWPKVSDGGIVRQLAQRAARTVGHASACPDAKGARWVEAVLDKDGTVRWARPVNRLSAQDWCVALEMEGASAGSRLKSPYRVRLQVRP